MSSSSSFTEIERKFQIISELSEGGYCFLKLAVMMPSFKTCKLDEFEHALERFRLSCGRMPIGKDMLIEVAVMQIRLKHMSMGGNPDSNELSFDRSVFNDLMSSNARFSLEEINGAYHIGTFAIDCCEHEDVICNHGNSSRMMITLLGSTNKKVGASIVNLDDIFGQEDDSTDLTMTPDQLIDQLQSQSYPNFMIADANDQVKEMEVEVESDRFSNNTLRHEHASANKQRSFSHDTDHTNIQDSKIRSSNISHVDEPTVDEILSKSSVLSEMIRKMDDLDAKLNDRLKSRMNVSSSEDDLTPNDSRSNLEVANKSYMRNGTVLTTRRTGRTQLENIVEVPRLMPRTDVVVGFVKTSEMEKKEHATNSKVKPINGLANPFTNNRLNLLLHFNTAVTTHMPIDDDTGYALSLGRIMSFKTRTPSEQLVKQMIERTFDFEEGVVIANPFKLPFIEVGMNISDHCLAACFSLLDDELQRLWFDSMKGLRTPKFHSRFNKYGESEINGKSRVSKRIASEKHHSNGTTISYVSRTSRQKQGSKWF